MKLRRLELSGFKSFADAVEFQIGDGVTAIIGPNGCGKSNVSDAVRWVLGEHNPRVLRGARMEEVIFQGSSGRRAQNVADVALVFDNADRGMDLDFAEVALSRRVSRSGESEYFINEAPVTRRELLAAIAGTGLGTDQGVVIEARMVDALLSDRPDDRRALFEEAAGLGLYRERKRSAERRLEETGTDLGQVENLIAEVQTRVRSLARQRRRAERHGEMLARRFQVVAALARSDAAAIDDALGQIVARRTALGAEVPTARAALADRDRERHAAAEARAGTEARRTEVERRVAEARLAVTTLEGDLALASERLGHASQRRDRALTEGGEASTSAARAERERDAAAAERAAAERDRAAVQQELAARQALEQAARDNLAAQRAAVRTVEEELQRQAEALRRLGGEREALERELADLREEQGGAEARRAALVRDLGVASTEAGDAHARQSSLSDRMVSLGLEAERARHALAEAREREARLRADRRAAEEALAQASARRDALRQLERDHVGLAPGSAALLGARERFGGGVLGPLSDFVRARRDDAAQVEHVLGEWLHAVLVTDLAACDAIHAWHRESNPGPLLLLPLDPGPADAAGGGDLAERTGAEGAAARWVRALLAGSRPFAPEGDAIVRANGAVFLPGHGAAAGPLRRRAELEALADDAARLEADLAELDRAIAAAAERLASAERDAAEADASLEATRGEERAAAAAADDVRRRLAHVERDLSVEVGLVTRLAERLYAAEERLGSVGTQLAAGDLERIRLEERLGRDRARLAELDDEQETTRERRVHWQVEEAQVTARFEAARDRETRAAAAMTELSTRAGTLDTEVAQLDAERATLETQRATWTEEITERRASLAELERAAVTAEQGVGAAAAALAVAEERLDGAREAVDRLSEEGHRLELDASELSASRRVMGERLAAEWGKDLDGILAEPATVSGDAEALRAEADTLRQGLEAMGPINALAVEEHAEETKRLEHLTTQRDDIVAAKSSLSQSIRELDVVARERFATTFGSARENFHRVFDTLFGGGECDLVLSDPTDPLEAEIEITARPRGKRTERLHLLSQGERSLVALSLLFGIYLTKPAPFCVLDEVDAPLDDANIGRFTKLLEEFKPNTQFIVITHNPRTMAVADALFGVTMQEPGVSSVVSVRLGEETQAA
jgi:chromosome segregation protein